MHLYKLCVDWVAAEDALRETHGHIHNHFCPPCANGTLHSFRVTSETWMDQYVVQEAEVDCTELLYDGYYQTCVDAHGRLDRKSAGCNDYQTVLEEKACSHFRSIHQTLRDFELIMFPLLQSGMLFGRTSAPTSSCATVSTSKSKLWSVSLVVFRNSMDVRAMK